MNPPKVGNWTIKWSGSAKMQPCDPLRAQRDINPSISFQIHWLWAFPIILVSKYFYFWNISIAAQTSKTPANQWDSWWIDVSVCADGVAGDIFSLPDHFTVQFLTLGGYRLTWRIWSEQQKNVKLRCDFFRLSHFLPAIVMKKTIILFSMEKY